jgi:4-hydroxybenzoate polyprenyltransferase
MPDDTRYRALQNSSPSGVNKVRNPWRTVRGYLALPHFTAVVVVEIATAAFAVIAWRGVPLPGLLAPLLLAMLGGQLVIGVTNEIVDYADDAAFKPDKPLPRGDVSLRGAQAMLVVGLVLMVGFGLSLGLTSFALLLLGSGFGVVYDLWLKRTRWSWLPYLLALPLLPIWVFVTLGRPEPRLLLLYPLGALATVGVHFAQALPDVAADRAAGLVTPTSQLGERSVFWLAWLATLSAPVLAWIAAMRLDLGGGSATIAVAGATTLGLLVINLGIGMTNRAAGYRLCFPSAAIATLLNCVAWVLAVAS